MRGTFSAKLICGERNNDDKLSDDDEHCRPSKSDVVEENSGYGRTDKGSQSECGRKNTWPSKTIFSKCYFLPMNGMEMVQKIIDCFVRSYF